MQGALAIHNPIELGPLRHSNDLSLRDGAMVVWIFDRLYPRPPLTLTLSPFALKSATGRGDGVAPVVSVGHRQAGS